MSDLLEIGSSAGDSLLHAASPEQRERILVLLDEYLAQTPADDPQRREQLLRDHADIAPLLEVYLTSVDQLHAMTADWNRSGGLASSAEPFAATGRIGEFELIRQIGRGGMGIVFEAQQRSLNRRVALKVLPFASMLDAKQIARFQNEAQAAAQLHHAHIVPIYAVGQEFGVYYYAMQLIDGQPLDVVIESLRAGASVLPAAADRSGPHDRSIVDPAQHIHNAVEMAADVAEALHFAHERGIIHRDIKPSNLLLDASGKAWVADFGLARCRADASFTRTGELVGTMRYMSPEQAAGQQALVDHRSDVYSLGATLYELLALVPAFSAETGPALLRQIADEEPPALHRQRPDAPRDLQTVIAKAMAKDRGERYATASDFADDLRRVLAGIPTLARPCSLAERAGKWARRHSRLVAGVAAASVLAAAGLVLATALVAAAKLRADENFTRAERHFRGAQEAVDRFGSRLAQRLASVPGAAAVRRELLQETRGYYQNFVAEARDDPALRADLALTYSKIGMLSDELGAAQEAIAAHRSALQLFEALSQAEPDVVELRRRLGVTLNNLGLALQHAGSLDEASGVYRTALAIQRQLVARWPENQQFACDLAHSCSNLGLCQQASADEAAADRSLRAAVALQEKLVAADGANRDYQRYLATSLNNLGGLHASADPEAAAGYYSRALSLQLHIEDDLPDDVGLQRDAALTEGNLGAVLAGAGQYARAIDAYARAIDRQQRLAARDPENASHQREWAVNCNNLGLAYSKLGDTEEAEKSFRAALDVEHRLVARNPGDAELRCSLGGIYNNLGMAMESANRWQDAVDAYEQAIDQQRAAHEAQPQVDRYRIFLSKHYFNCGRVLRQLERSDEAVQMALVRRALWPRDPERLLAVAEELALAGQAAARDDHPSIVERATELTLQTLHAAQLQGLALSAEVAAKPAFASLKSHAEFTAMIAK